MSMPMYVSPEQLMQDRADYARKGIARGRSLVVLEYKDGVAFVADNKSSTLRKISEIYDRIGFGGVGRYNEFDQLRIAGVRHAELKGFQYSREDVDGRSLANQYAQMLGQIFTHEMKPMEVEIVVAELGVDAVNNELYRVQYDGTVVDEHGFCSIGGDAEAVRSRLQDGYAEGLNRNQAIRLATDALAEGSQVLEAATLEVALLEAGGERRCFMRLDDPEVQSALEG
ncbi:MAG TPA: proteasome subunit alpha [Acidimicrobiaceae bacterium]|nr:proteasome subunit alpha [Actinomycetota bacterium]HAN07518.1 proteasome subunit alpha [Acidimicrobiaceae bacterium]